ncbi:MAG: alanine racemase [Gammaproteobacteria bacterium]|nr:alanine racemase [Gammaproteobacteria bacterium]
MGRTATFTVDADALRHNLEVARRAAPGSRTMAVIKGNGYGHGALRVARALESTADRFAVARMEEALALREGGITTPVVLLAGAVEPADVDLAADHAFDLVAHSAWQVELLERARPARPIRAWLKIDSGMHRVGVGPAEARALWQRLAEAASVAGRPGVMTHLACADEPGSAHTRSQLETFAEACRDLEAERSLANSAGVLNWPASHADWIRPGIMLYGGSAQLGRYGPDLGLRPAMNLDTRLVSVQQRQRGDTVGYGAAGVCPEAMPVGAAAIGYADGYPRHAPQGTPVLVNGRRAALIGRVSMDLINIDLRNVPDARPGDPVRLWGEGLPADEVAEHAGTIAYELFCRVASRVVYREA